MFEFIQQLALTGEGNPADNDPVIILCGKETVIFDNGETRRLPVWVEVKTFVAGADAPFRVGNLDGQNCFALESGLPPVLPETLKQWPIRQFLFEFPESETAALCRARGLLSWRKQHRFCGCCRSELRASEHDSGLFCPACKSVYYPQLAPAVIVAITRNGGRELLLAHNRNFSGNIHSLIAGFVECGESLEAAVSREIWEECSIKVKNLQYVTSQFWPFPNSLMLAFIAEYESGEARPDGVELTGLGWFTADDHPELPAPGSVARAVIDRIFATSTDHAH